MQQNIKKSLENNLKLFKFPFLPGIVWAIMILVLMTMSGNSFPKFDLINILSLDKFVHTFVFFILQLLLCYGFYKQKNKLKRFPILISSIITFTYGIGTEIVQAVFSLNRKGDYLDVIANSIGIIIAILLCKFLLKKLETS